VILGAILRFLWQHGISGQLSIFVI